MFFIVGLVMGAFIGFAVASIVSVASDEHNIIAPTNEGEEHDSTANNG